MADVIVPPLGGFQIAINAPQGTQLQVLGGFGDPNLLASDNAGSDIATSSTGSIFLRMDGGASTSLYVKTGVNSQSAPTGTWTPK
jgi:hypothetical protein